MISKAKKSDLGINEKVNNNKKLSNVIVPFSDPKSNIIRSNF